MAINPAIDTASVRLPYQAQRQPGGANPQIVAQLQQLLGLPATGVLDKATVDALSRALSQANGGQQAQGGGGNGGANGLAAGGNGFENLIDKVLLGGDDKQQRRAMEQALGQLSQMLRAPSVGNAGRTNTGGSTLRNEAARRGIDRTMDRNRAGVTGDPANSPTRPGMQGFLDEIAEGEGTGDAKARKMGFESGYDVTLGYGAYTPNQFKGKKLTDMTIGEVKQLQAGMLRHPANGHNSSAVGKYQIVGTTLRGLQKQMGISDNEKFTPELQDKMAMKLLEGRGLNKFLSGRMSASAFQDAVAKEWASVATSGTGRSFYGQGTGTSTSEILAAIRGLRTNTNVA